MFATMKIVKPLRVIALSALTMTLVCIATGYLFFLSPNRYSLTAVAVTLSILLFILSFLLFRLIYKRFLIQPIYEVYRNIARLRNLKERNFGWNEDHQVEKEINFILLKWSSESREEMKQFKQVETYRREFLSNVSH